MERSAPPVTRERTLCDPRPACVTKVVIWRVSVWALGFRNIEGVTRRKYTSSTDRTPSSLLYRDPFSDTRRHEGSAHEAAAGLPSLRASEREGDRNDACFCLLACLRA